MSKSQNTNTVSHSLQQEGGKYVQIGRPQTVLSTSLTKGVTTLDEFKHGFPSEGLSTVSYKWWGSNSPDGYESISKDVMQSGDVSKQRQPVDDAAGSVTMDEEKSGNAEERKRIGPQGTGLLTAVRKKIAEEGREALKLGVTKRYGANKLGKREKALLLRIFKSSTMQEWMNGTSKIQG
ncbi:hypothetical protein TorRG33x02_250590 [Trema orientale]|uniref:Uncharacterized protein n=1 Tax=Trema orientale TaxID=63057 RepID=A0A2P5DII5_TREOI|nr:hypothetical protein TorRG33x02_250590 [Trema orientale]